MSLSPRLYRWLVRPPKFTNFYIHDLLAENFFLQNKKALDFGCGVGTTCTLFNPEKYLGVDINQARINYAKKLYPNYQFQALNHKGQLPFRKNSFDLILIIAVLHHIPQPELTTLLDDFRQILKPNGRIISIEPCFSAKAKLNNLLMDFLDNGDYIRSKQEYFSLFNRKDFAPNLIKTYSKLFFYNELFFTATY